MLTIARLLLVYLFFSSATLRAQSAAETVEVDVASKDASFPVLQELRVYLNYLETNKILAGETAGTIFVSGGFSSCHPRPGGVEVYTALIQHLWERAAHGEYYRVVAACFSLQNSPIYYLSPEHFELAKPGDVNEIAAALNRQIGLNQNENLFMIGHSYGGWLALKLALEIHEDVNLLGMVTLDPISTVGCSPGSFMYAYLRSIVSRRPEPECNRAPSDIDENDLASIANRSDWWLNFYQSNSSYLHSSAISGAENHHIAYSFTSPWALVSAHGAIDTDDRVWQLLGPKLRIFE